MNWLWWVLGIACVGGVLLLLALAALVVMAHFGRKMKARVIEQGDHTTGWLVQANSSLFEDGWMDLPALVLLSPDPQTAADEELLTDLAGRIMELKGVNPDDCDDEDDAFVAGLMADEAYIQGKRDELPQGFAGRRRVYLAHILVSRKHLPNQRIEEPSLPCAVIWGEPNSPVFTRPPAPPRRRRRDEET